MSSMLYEKVGKKKFEKHTVLTVTLTVMKIYISYRKQVNVSVKLAEKLRTTKVFKKLGAIHEVGR